MILYCSTLFSCQCIQPLRKGGFMQDKIILWISRSWKPMTNTQLFCHMFVKCHGNSCYFQILSTYDKPKNTFAKTTNFTYACHTLLTRGRNLMLSILHKGWIDKYSFELPLSIKLQNVSSLKIINFFQLFLCFPLGGESGLFYWIYLFSQWLHLDYFFFHLMQTRSSIRNMTTLGI